MDPRQPVLHDARTAYPHLSCGRRPGDDPARDVSVISQGGVVYNASLKRYIYTSWTWYTFEFYEAPTPWGPWKLFLHKDSGAEAFYGPSENSSCPGPRNGGYPTTIPSKFISADGKRMWVQSSTWKRWNFACGKPDYSFGLRQLDVAPFVETRPANAPDAEANLAITGQGCVPIEKSDRYGHMAWLRDGDAAHSESSYDCNSDKTEDFWGYVWTRAYHLNRVIYTAGTTHPDGGWFDDLRVQVRQDFRWIDVQAADNAALSAQPPCRTGRTLCAGLQCRAGRRREEHRDAGWRSEIHHRCRVGGARRPLSASERSARLFRAVDRGVRWKYRY